MGSWTFNLSGFALLVALTAGLFFSALAWRNLRRSEARWQARLLEWVRLLVVALLLLTLLQPERLRQRELRNQPEAVVLCDASGSMNTRDQAAAGGELVSRAAFLKARLDAKFLARLQPRYNVTVEYFAGSSGSATSTDLAAALERTQARHRDLRAVLLVSDGDWNQGEDPIGAALKLRAAQAPVVAVAVGSPSYLPDLVLERAELPAFCMLNEKVLVPFAVQSHMPRDVRTKVTLQTARGLPQEKSLDIPAGGRADGFFLWQPASAGEDSLTVSLPVEKEEAVTENNSFSFPLQVRGEKLRVLIVETLPRWEYRYLRNALVRDPGVAVTTVLTHQSDMAAGDGPGYLKSVPASKDELSKYDVVFLGDIGIGDRELTAEQAGLLCGLVREQGSGLVFLPGSQGRQLTLAAGPLAELLPVVYDKEKPDGLFSDTESHMDLTSIGADHLLTMLAETPAASQRLWKRLPGFYWNAAVEKAAPGARVLAVHESLNAKSGRMPLLVVRPAGNGQVLFLGTDSAWRWRRGVEDKYHYRFWGQVVRWMAHKRHLAYREGVRLFYAPENPAAGDRVSLQATVLDRDGFPVTGGLVACRIRAPGGAETLTTLEPVPGGWGVFKGTFSPEQGGVYSVTVTCAQTGLAFESKLTVAEVAVEQTGKPARFAVLQDLASVTGGRFLTADRLDEAVLAVAQLPEPDVQERRLQLWCQWWWGAILVGMLGLYWALRKWHGLV